MPTSQKKTKLGKSEKSEKVKRRQEKRKPSKDEFDEEEKPEKPVQREEEIPAVWDSSDEELTQQNEPPGMFMNNYTRLRKESSLLLKFLAPNYNPFIKFQPFKKKESDLIELQKRSFNNHH